MSDPAENLTSVYLRRLDANFVALCEDMADLKHRFTPLEVQVSNLAATKASHDAQLAVRLNRIEHRLERLADMLPA